MVTIVLKAAQMVDTVVETNVQNPGWFLIFLGVILPSYMGSIINHCKDPYI